jgi:hypothetical protein
VKAIWGAVETLPPFVGEAFGCIDTIDRSRFLPGAVVSSRHFTSATTRWALATDLIGVNFAKRGTVFIFQSQTGRLTSGFGKFPFDQEVVFAPCTRWRVVKWYRGNPLCLSQPGIRENDYEIKDTPHTGHQTYIDGVRPIAIELVEVPPE